MLPQMSRERIKVRGIYDLALVRVSPKSAGKVDILDLENIRAIVARAGQPALYCIPIDVDRNLGIVMSPLAHRISDAASATECYVRGSIRIRWSIREYEFDVRAALPNTKNLIRNDRVSA